MTAAAPSGVVTFLLTNIEGSTRRWESDADVMRSALVAHDTVLRGAIEAHDGFLFSHTGEIRSMSGAESPVPVLSRGLRIRNPLW
jgi:class 3 adenylate cyclase